MSNLLSHFYLYSGDFDAFNHPRIFIGKKAELEYLFIQSDILCQNEELVL